MVLNNISIFTSPILLCLILSLLSITCSDYDISKDQATEKSNQRSCSQRYIPSGSKVESQAISYQSAANCTGGEQSGAREMGNYIRLRFAAIMDLSIPGDGIQIYNCRSVRGGRTMSLHGEGRAIDIFIKPLSGWVADNSKGDLIANWLIDNASELGIQSLIWDRTIWKGSGASPRHRCYKGDSPHVDHIHAELTWDAALRRTRFFTLGPEVLRSPPPIPTKWIGESCQSDEDCISSANYPQPTCLRTNQSTSGMCSFSCQGFCPDLLDKALSFCIDAQVLSQNSEQGLCVLQSQSGQCDDEFPSIIESHSRYTGSSRARPIEANVCLPLFLLNTMKPEPEPEPEPEPVPEPEPEPDSANNGICEDPMLELSDHDSPCPSFPENFWRCACSAMFETTISQVCRNGSWINYTTNPRDCSTCSGSYSSACEMR